MEHLYQLRRANLRGLLRELACEGLSGLDAQASLLVTRGIALKGMLDTDPISHLFARNVEWTMQRRYGWMDEDHREDPF
jgi:hypothetical protein